MRRIAELTALVLARGEGWRCEGEILHLRRLRQQRTGSVLGHDTTGEDASTPLRMSRRRLTRRRSGLVWGKRGAVAAGSSTARDSMFPTGRVSDSRLRTGAMSGPWTGRGRTPGDSGALVTVVEGISPRGEGATEG